MTDKEKLETVMDSLKERQVKARMLKEQRDSKIEEINNLSGSTNFTSFVSSSEYLSDSQKEILLGGITDDNSDSFIEIFNLLMVKVSESVEDIYARYKNI